jgi:hypothetical protein
MLRRVFEELGIVKMRKVAFKTVKTGLRFALA